MALFGKKPRGPRRKTSQPAWMTVDGSFAARPCTVLDISDSGARLLITGKARLAIWAPTLIFYFPLATLALYRALWDVVRDPFRWEKTAHGIHVPSGPVTPPPVTPPPAPLPNRGAAGS